MGISRSSPSPRESVPAKTVAATRCSTCVHLIQAAPTHRGPSFRHGNFIFTFFVDNKMPDGDYSDRSNPAGLCVPSCMETAVVCPLASEPTEPLLENHQAGQE